MRQTLLIFTLLFVGFGTLSAQEQESIFDQLIFEYAALSFNIDETEWSDDEDFGNTLDLFTVYGLYEMGQFENQDFTRNKHGIVVNASFPAANRCIETQVTSVCSGSFGINFGGGYGVHINDFSGYGTLNTGVFSIFNSDAEGFDGPETDFFPSNSAFLKFAGMYTPFAVASKGTQLGVHAALNVSLAENGGSSFLIGLAISPR